MLMFRKKFHQKLTEKIILISFIYKLIKNYSQQVQLGHFFCSNEEMIHSENK